MQVSFFRAALPSLLACLMAATATAATSTHPCGSIVYTQALRGTDGSVVGSGLSLASPADGTSRALTAALDGIIDDSASWSPDGRRVAFEHRASTNRLAQRFDILTFDTRTRQVRKITKGAGNLVNPAWGPSNRIAYVSQYRQRSCLSMVEANGRQHDLYCPPSPAKLMTPVWSKDGRNLFVQAGYTLPGPDGFWRSIAYRIDAATGAPFVLDDRVFDSPQHLEFAPNGRRGIYANVEPYSADMEMVEFATGAGGLVGTGYAPRWSKDGSRIAYTGEVYELTNPVRYYEPLYVMQADGSNPRRVTRTRVDNEAYTSADWSKDGVHLLVNRRIYLDPSLTIPQYDLRIVNVDSGAQTRLPAAGVANAGAWFEN
jgi:Tol biopolymer transport system component